MKPVTHPQKNRILSYDILRILAILAVVMIHTSCQGFYTLPVNTTSFKTSLLLDSLSRFAVPIFVMISGALMLDETKDLSSKKIFKKTLTLFIALCVWSFVYSVAYSVVYPITEKKSLSFTTFIKKFIFGKKYIFSCG